MAVEKRNKRVVVYFTESEHQALTWAAGPRQAAGPPTRCGCWPMDWANNQIARAQQEGGGGQG